jgi:membrane protease YdiL (CAAX protease family)
VTVTSVSGAEAGQRRARSAFYVGLAIMAAYMLVRWGVYAIADRERLNWFERDTTMDVPRLLALVAALVFGVRRWGRAGLGMHFGHARLGIIGGAALVALWLPNHFFREHPIAFPASALFILAVSSFIVAAMEETLFRGVLFNALSEWGDQRDAIWLSSALFTVYHVQAQPLWSWPALFLYGIAAAVFRGRGVGLPWLILQHGLYDSLVFLGSSGESLIGGLQPLLFVAQCIFVVVLYVSWRRTSAVPSTRRKTPL